MFRNAFQKGLFTLFYSMGSKPLTIWRTCAQNGHIKRVSDEDVKSVALEIMGTNVITTYITTPISKTMSLGIRLPFLVLLIKNMRKFFSFEVQILDDKHFLRRFRISNYQTATRVQEFNTSMPLGLSPGWNQIQFNLADFTRRAYGTNYLETVRVQIHANIRIRRIYFTDQLRKDEDLPNEYRLMTSKPIIRKKNDEKSPVRPTTPTKSQEAALQIGGQATPQAAPQAATA